MESQTDTTSEIPVIQSSFRTTRPTANLKNVPFHKLCEFFTNYHRSPEGNRWYPPNHIHKHDKQNFRKRANQFRWDEGRQKLFHQHTDAIGIAKWVPVLPCEKEQLRLIRECHEGVGNSIEARALSGHFGRDKTTALISSRVFFPNIKMKVTNFVVTCESCQRVKAGSKFEKGGDKLKSIPVPHETWAQVGIDLITNLPESPDGLNTLCTVIDYKTKWVESKALKGKTAYGVAYFLYELLCRHGVAKIHISDQGREFINNVSAEYYQLTGVTHRMTSAYHPQANGEVERFNRTTQECFLKTQEIGETVKKIPDWFRKVNSILFGYRVSKQASTGFSPFRMMYGREPVVPFQLNEDLLPLDMSKESPDIPLNYTFEHMEVIRESVSEQEAVREILLDKGDANIAKAQKHQAKHYNAKHARNEFLPGEKVYKRNPLCNTKIKSLKRGPNWLGPYTVNRRNAAGNYLLIDKHGKELKKAFPPCHLKRHLQRPKALQGSDDEYGSAPETEEDATPINSPFESIPGSHSSVTGTSDTVLYANTEEYSEIPGRTGADVDFNEIPGRTNEVDMDVAEEIPVRTNDVDMDVAEEIPGRTMEAAEILAGLANGGLDLDSSDTITPPRSPTTEILASLADISESPTDSSAPPSVALFTSEDSGSEIIDPTLEEFDIDLVVNGVSPPTPSYFYPLTPYVRKGVAMNLCVATGRAAGKRDTLGFTGVGSLCTSNFDSKEVAFDGNCLFRTLSYLVTGTEEKHDIIRTQLCEYIENPENFHKLSYRLHGYTSGADYIANKRMRTPTVWGTDVEIAACALLSKKDILLHTSGSWHRFTASGIQKKTTKHAFYIDHPNRNHFNPVMGMKY